MGPGHPAKSAYLAARGARCCAQSAAMPQPSQSTVNTVKGASYRDSIESARTAIAMTCRAP
jgi:hypothetical protein